jgi:hypothetical protein
MSKPKSKTTKKTAKRPASVVLMEKIEADKMLELLTWVSDLRQKVRRLVDSPTVARALAASIYNDTTLDDLRDMDMPLHQIIDGAATRYAQMVERTGSK